MCALIDYRDHAEDIVPTCVVSSHTGNVHGWRRVSGCYLAMSASKAMSELPIYGVFVSTRSYDGLESLHENEYERASGRRTYDRCKICFPPCAAECIVRTAAVADRRSGSCLAPDIRNVDPLSMPASSQQV